MILNLPGNDSGYTPSPLVSWTREVTPGVNPSETLYQEAENDIVTRVTSDGDYRILAETPSDLYPQNADTFEAPYPDYLYCDRTGFKVSVKEGLKEEWTGAMVRKESWEPRHPQELLRVRPEKQHGSERPGQPDEFIDISVGVSVSDLG